MVNGPTTPIPVKATPSSTDPVVPPVNKGMNTHQLTHSITHSQQDTQAIYDNRTMLLLNLRFKNTPECIMSGKNIFGTNQSLVSDSFHL